MCMADALRGTDCAMLVGVLSPKGAMNERYLHLVLNHFPVILSVMALLSSLLAMVTKSRAAWLYAAASLPGAGRCSDPTVLTGHGAHEGREDVLWVNSDAGSEHHKAAVGANGVR